MGKRILKLSKWASSSAVNVWPIMKARILVRKLEFLLRLVSADGHALGASKSDDMKSCLVRKCRKQTYYTDNILGCRGQVNVQDIKEEVYKMGNRMVLKKCGKLCVHKQQVSRTA